MDGENANLESSLDHARQQLEQELSRFDRLDRALTDDEQPRVEALRKLRDDILELSEQVPSANDAGSAVTAAADAVVLRDGRYVAGNPQFQAEIRLDAGQTRIVSMDIFSGQISPMTYLASLRSNPGAPIRRGQRNIKVIGEDEDGNQAAGTLNLSPLSDTQATVTLVFQQGLNGLPVSVPLVLSATWQSAFFRVIGIEVDQEQDTPPSPSYQFNGQLVTMDSCFRNAGIEIISAGERDAIPPPAQPWDDSQLHGLMSSFADETLIRKAWTLHLLLLSESSLEGLLGVMFDTGEADANGLPRQGAAIFTKPIQGHPAGFERKMLQTTVHELGHALNLAHRFERVVSRADSTSFMNYDWRYFGGNRREQFWQDFRFCFDADELRFFRHAPFPALIPGGAEFHTINYWSDGTGGYSPYAPEVVLEGLELALKLPDTGPLFGFSQPVTLTVELRNTSGRPLNIPRQYLDPKSGFLEILIRRLGPRRRRLSEDRMPFSPILTRCWDRKRTAGDVVPSGGAMTNNVNLTFGSAGFTFAEPGNYEITAVLSLFDSQRGIDRVVRSDPTQLRIAHPRSAQEERDAISIFRKDVGYYLALGGSDKLKKAGEILEEIRERRQGKDKEVTDPLVAHIMRCQAINSSRDFTTYEKGVYKTRPAERSKSAKLLQQLETSARQYFDPATQKSNKALLDRVAGKGK